MSSGRPSLPAHDVATNPTARSTCIGKEGIWVRWGGPSKRFEVKEEEAEEEKEGGGGCFFDARNGLQVCLVYRIGPEVDGVSAQCVG